MMFLANVLGGFFSYQYKPIFEAHHKLADGKENDADYIIAGAASAAGIV